MRIFMRSLVHVLRQLLQFAPPPQLRLRRLGLRADATKIGTESRPFLNSEHHCSPVLIPEFVLLYSPLASSAENFLSAAAEVNREQWPVHREVLYRRNVVG